MKLMIVGGGILGASVAYHAARAGAETYLVDMGHQGRATAAGAGIVCPWTTAGRDADYYRLSCAAARYYPELIGQLTESGASDLSYRKVGALLVTGDPNGMDEREALVRERVADAPEAGEVSRLPSDQARALFPPLRPDWEALHVEGAARVDGLQLSAALRGAARGLGAREVTGRAALSLSGDRVVGVNVDGNLHDADAVVLCAGAWDPALLAPLGLRLGIAPQRGQIVHLGLPGTDTSRWPVLLFPGDKYMLAFDDSRVVVGATRENASGFDYRVTAAGQAEVLNAGLEVAPGLADGTLLETRIGFRPMSPDGRPLIGKVAGVEGLYLGNGLGPTGLTAGPYAGRLLSQLVLGEPPTLPLGVYDPMRLAS